MNSVSAYVSSLQKYKLSILSQIAYRYMHSNREDT